MSRPLVALLILRFRRSMSFQNFTRYIIIVFGWICPMKLCPKIDSNFFIVLVTTKWEIMLIQLTSVLKGVTTNKYNIQLVQSFHHNFHCCYNIVTKSVLVTNLGLKHDMAMTYRYLQNFMKNQVQKVVDMFAWM